MNRDRFVFVLGQDPDKWAQRWGLEPFTHPCSRCGAMCRTTVPFVCGQMRGLASPICKGCGDRGTPYCLVRDYRCGDLVTAVQVNNIVSGRSWSDVVEEFLCPRDGS